MSNVHKPKLCHPISKKILNHTYVGNMYVVWIVLKFQHPKLYI